MATGSSGGAGGSGGVRRSLVDSTAGAFARRAVAEAALATPVAAAAGLAALTGAADSWGDSPALQRAVQIGSHRTRPRSGGTVTAPTPAPTSGVEAPAFDLSKLPPRDFQRLVDSIVETLEQRVVDELERRGRRHPGVF